MAKKKLLIFILFIISAVLIWSIIQTKYNKSYYDLMTDNDLDFKNIIHEFDIDGDNKKIVFYERLKSSQIGVVFLEKGWFDYKFNSHSGFAIIDLNKEINWAFSQGRIEGERIPILYGVIDAKYKNLLIKYQTNKSVKTEEATIIEKEEHELYKQNFWYLIIDGNLQNQPTFNPVT